MTVPLFRQAPAEDGEVENMDLWAYKRCWIYKRDGKWYATERDGILLEPIKARGLKSARAFIDRRDGQ